MASIIQINGKWRATVRVKKDGKLVLNTTRSHASKRLAEAWAREVEVKAQSEGGLSDLAAKGSTQGITVRALIEKYIEYVTPLKPLGKTKRVVLENIAVVDLGALPASALSSNHLLEFCRARRERYGNTASTLAQYIGYLRQVFELAPTAWGIRVSTAPFDEAKPMLRKLGLIGQGGQRERRLEGEEYARLLDWFEQYDTDRARAVLMAPVFQFAVASAMRREEICRICRSDIDIDKRTVIIRDRKDPRNKQGNDQVVPLLGSSWEIVQQQLSKHREDRIFPYAPISISAIFHRACEALGIVDLTFHDLRHEGASLLFEAGYRIEQVALVTGHKSWNMLRRYTQLRPESLHDLDAASNLNCARESGLLTKRTGVVKRRVWVVKTPDGFLCPLSGDIGWADEQADAGHFFSEQDASDFASDFGGVFEVECTLVSVDTVNKM